MTKPDMSKRGILQTGALMATGAIVGCATPGTAANAPATPFTVAETYIPIAGSAEMFPVRRIYCIGRNYAAHAIEMGSDPTASRPSFSRSRPTPSRWYRPARSPTIPIPR
jgi:fumarylpyruvate hydrolase